MHESENAILFWKNWCSFICFHIAFDKKWLADFLFQIYI